MKKQEGIDTEGEDQKDDTDIKDEQKKYEQLELFDEDQVAPI